MIPEMSNGVRHKYLLLALGVLCILSGFVSAPQMILPSLEMIQPPYAPGWPFEVAKEPISSPASITPQIDAQENVLHDTPLEIVAVQEIPIILKTLDGVDRSGTLTLRDNATATIILCHPAAYDQDFMSPFCSEMFDRFHCLRFNFRRHGEKCKDNYCSFGSDEYREVQAAVKFVQSNEHTKDLPLIGFGISMGAAALIESESKTPFFDGLILQSTFESLRKQIKRMFTLYRLPWMHNFIFRGPAPYIARKKYNLKLVKFKPVESIKKINTPIFLIHAQNDTFVGFEAFEELCTAGESIVKTWAPKDGKHTEIFKTHPKEYTKKCNDFVDYILKTKKLASNKPCAQGELV